MGILEAEGREDTFLMGIEESYGLLAGNYVRDKDGIEAMLLTCEAAADYHSRGLDLVDALGLLQDEVGFYRDIQISKHYLGLGGADEMRSVMRSFRMHPLKEIAGRSVLEFIDYSGGIEMPILNAAPNEPRQVLPASNVLQFNLEGGGRIIVRPSGTEPKLKIYLSVCGKSEEESNSFLEALTASISSVLEGIR